MVLVSQYSTSTASDSATPPRREGEQIGESNKQTTALSEQQSLIIAPGDDPQDIDHTLAQVNQSLEGTGFKANLRPITDQQHNVVGFELSVVKTSTEDDDATADAVALSYDGEKLSMDFEPPQAEPANVDIAIDEESILAFGMQASDQYLQSDTAPNTSNLLALFDDAWTDIAQDQGILGNNEQIKTTPAALPVLQDLLLSLGVDAGDLDSIDPALESQLFERAISLGLIDPMAGDLELTKADAQQLSASVQQTPLESDNSQPADQSLSPPVWGEDNSALDTPVESAEPSTESTTQADGQIGEIQQKKSGTCWLLTGMMSVAESPAGQQIIDESITANEDGSYTVVFAGDPSGHEYTVTPEQLQDVSMEGDMDAAILEAAARQHYARTENGRDISAGGANEGLALISGAPIEEQSLSKDPATAKQVLLDSARAQGDEAGHVTMMFGTTAWLDANGDTVTNGDNGRSHMLSITNINEQDNTISYKNPWNSSEIITQDLDDFAALQASVNQDSELEGMASIAYTTEPLGASSTTSD